MAMESIEVDRSLYDIGDSDLKELWAQDSFESPMVDISSESDWSTILDNPIILHDRMMSDAVQSPRIQSEHSYSMTSSDEGPDSPLSITPHIKIEDMDSECFPAVPVSTVTGQSDLAAAAAGGVVVKQEPMSPPPAPPTSPPPPPSRKTSNRLLSSALASAPLVAGSLPASLACVASAAATAAAATHLHHHHQQQQQQQQQQSLLKQPTIVLATARHERHMVYPKVKLEPPSGFVLPPTPPSSHSSDSDGSLSPVHSTENRSPTSFTVAAGGGSPDAATPSSQGTSSGHGPSHPAASSSSSSMSRRSQSHSRVAVTSSSSSSSCSSSSSSSRGSASGGSQLISNQAKGATGVLILTDEEKRTLLAEGYPIPQRLPLTKAEERSLKKIRRKIKNKISAQESRRKKKEYMDSLEKRVETLLSENQEYKKKVDVLENSNRSLLSQLQRLQVLLGNPTVKSENLSTASRSSKIHMDFETDDEQVDII
ncbi:cyclic AMP response element-binding protein A-like isoform X2 [Dermacentor albipictus]|uniref:cyclic AMP response element-binding protein A-like isoform X2 n=1 Tax=Dermacentor albipictus TaxID=60249 RepID=UPI0031FC4F19